MTPPVFTVGNRVRNRRTSWVGTVAADLGNYLYAVAWDVTGETRDVAAALLEPEGSPGEKAGTVDG